MTGGLFVSFHEEENKGILLPLRYRGQVVSGLKANLLLQLQPSDAHHSPDPKHRYAE